MSTIIKSTTGLLSIVKASNKRLDKLLTKQAAFLKGKHVKMPTGTNGRKVDASSMWVRPNKVV